MGAQTFAFAAVALGGTFKFSKHATSLSSRQRVVASTLALAMIALLLVILLPRDPDLCPHWPNAHLRLHFSICQIVSAVSCSSVETSDWLASKTSIDLLWGCNLTKDSDGTQHVHTNSQRARLKTNWREAGQSRSNLAVIMGKWTDDGICGKNWRENRKMEKFGNWGNYCSLLELLHPSRTTVLLIVTDIYNLKLRRPSLIWVSKWWRVAHVDYCLISSRFQWKLSTCVVLVIPC